MPGLIVIIMVLVAILIAGYKLMRSSDRINNHVVYFMLVGFLVVSWMGALKVLFVYVAQL